MSQHQEGRLEGVLGVLFVLENMAAHAQDELTVPLHQGGEGAFVASIDETLQQMAVGQFARRLFPE